MTTDIEALKAELVEAKSHAAFYANTMIKLRNTLIGVTTDIQDEGDRVYFGSTNDADRLKAITRKVDDLAWDEIMADSQPPVNLYDSIERLSGELSAAKAQIEEFGDPLYCQICGSCGSDGCGCEHKCVYAHLHPDVVASKAALVDALERIEAATPYNTNSETAKQAFSWTSAVARNALDDIASTITECAK